MFFLILGHIFPAEAFFAPATMPPAPPGSAEEYLCQQQYANCLPECYCAYVQYRSEYAVPQQHYGTTKTYNTECHYGDDYRYFSDEHLFHTIIFIQNYLYDHFQGNGIR